MTLMGLPPSFGTQRRILESRKDLSMDIIKKYLRQEALRLKAEQAQQLQGNLAVNLTRRQTSAQTRRRLVRALLKVCDNTHSLELLEQPGNPDPRRHRARFDNVPSAKENSKTFAKNGKQTMRVCDFHH